MLRSVARYTIKNVMEIEETASARLPGLEGRFARRHIDSEHIGVSYIRYGPGVRDSNGHSHREQEEVYVVIAGSGRVKLDDEVRELGQWDIVRLAPEVVRAFEGGAEGLTLIAIGSDRPPDGDGILVRDWWAD
jgi:mannose-6-phosphate isomerase-like protein (cupin superfamily)